MLFPSPVSLASMITMFWWRVAIRSLSSWMNWSRVWIGYPSSSGLPGVEESAVWSGRVEQLVRHQPLESEVVDPVAVHLLERRLGGTKDAHPEVLPPLVPRLDELEHPPVAEQLPSRVRLEPCLQRGPRSGGERKGTRSAARSLLDQQGTRVSSSSTFP